MRKSLLILPAFAILAMFANCKKSSPAPTYTAKVMFVNGCAGTVNVNVTQQTTAVSGAQNLGFLKNSGYQDLPGGSDSIAFILTSTGTPLKSATLGFTAKLNYSVFLGGLVNNSAILYLADDLTPPASGNAKIRLVNLSMDALSVTGNAGTSVFASNIASGNGSAFSTIPAGSYTIKAGDPSDINSVVSAPAQQFASGKLYTVIYAGTGSGTLTSALSLTVIGN